MSKPIAFKQCTVPFSPSYSSLEQQRYSFNDQYLAALLQVYKDYYPDVIISNFRRAKSSVFRVLSTISDLLIPAPGPNIPSKTHSNPISHCQPSREFHFYAYFFNKTTSSYTNSGSPHFWSNHQIHNNRGINIPPRLYRPSRENPIPVTNGVHPPRS